MTTYGSILSLHLARIFSAICRIQHLQRRYADRVRRRLATRLFNSFTNCLIVSLLILNRAHSVYICNSKWIWLPLDRLFIYVGTKFNVIKSRHFNFELATSFYCFGHWRKRNIIDTCSDFTWRRHQMETFSVLLVICAGNSPTPVNFLHKG